MYISDVIIGNFRGIGKETIFKFNPGITVLVGENDSGKSTVIDAIRYVLGTTDQNWYKVEFSDYHNENTEDEIRISICFSDLSLKEKAAFMECLTYTKTGEKLYLNWTAKYMKNVKPNRTLVNLTCGKNGDVTAPSPEARELLRVTLDNNGIYHLTKYALTHVDECCYVFNLGYTYESAYQGLKDYAMFMAKANPLLTSRECSYDPSNAHNKALNALMDNAQQRANALRRYPGSFAETLVQLQKEKKLSNKQLADLSLVGEKTIQRIRNDEEYPTSKQTVLGLCVGLSLSPAEAEDFFGKSDFKLNSTKTEDYIYKCILGACANNSIYAINEMLVEHGMTPLGSGGQE